MTLARELISHLLIAAMLIEMLIVARRGVKYRDHFVRQLTTEPGRRARVYRFLIVRSWIWAAVVALVALLSPGLSTVDLGWAWPGGDGIDYLLTGWLLVMMSVGALRIRGRMRRGHVIPGRAGTAPLVPRTAYERRLAAGVALSVGISEEVVYRGLLIGVGTQLYGLPPAAAVFASLALFVVAHTYQGRRGMVGIAVLGGMFTFVYLISGSLLLAIVLHVFQDLLALLLIPAYPTARQVSDDTATVPATETAGHARPAASTPALSQSSAMAAQIRPPYPGEGSVLRSTGG
ncbi:CPBP family intramembrane glutamic endopeptidase [Actinoplanes sp. NPDC005259]|uniref:CPBP family intramembrane glutamic endopeptidase n=1 Tax=Actinoplanes sp. NPDC005259 TaxID=3154674 RepID=UPI0033B08946